PQEQGHLAKTHTIDPEAYELYLKGHYLWNKRTEEGGAERNRILSASDRKGEPFDWLIFKNPCGIFAEDHGLGTQKSRGFGRVCRLQPRGLEKYPNPTSVPLTAREPPHHSRARGDAPRYC